MARIRSRNTGPERTVRAVLTSLGYRYRLNRNDLPGRPDVVLRKYSAVIFVHGCFWHLHSGCRDGTIPKTNTRHWRQKLFRNVKRDREHVKALRKAGWRVLILWECAIEKKAKYLPRRLHEFLMPRNGKSKEGQK